MAQQKVVVTDKTIYVTKPNALKALLGEKFLSKKGDTTFQKSLVDADIIGLYFSAHWCPPCRGFTPRLKDCYTRWVSQGKKVEIIFITSDSDEKSFKSYFTNDHGDWLAIHFGSEQIKSIKQKFNIRGIPSLVFLDKNANTLDTAGRMLVANKGVDAISELEAKLPKEKAEPVNGLKKIVGDKFLSKKGEKKFNESLSNKDVVGLYFSAHWCPPCRGFTPLLKEFYTKWVKDGNKVEIIFVTSDRDDAAMKSYFNNDHGDWLALPFGDDTIKAVKKKYNITGIPSLVFLDSNGNTLEAGGRMLVANKGADAINDLVAKLPKKVVKDDEKMDQPAIVTRVVETSIIKASVDKVWNAIRNCKFGFSKNIKKTDAKNDDGVVGGIRTIYYSDADNTKQTVQVMEISDVKYNLVFRVIASEPSVNYSSATHAIKLMSVTTTDETFISFTSDYSNDANVQVIQDSKWKKREFFDDLTKLLNGK